MWSFQDLPLSFVVVLLLVMPSSSSPSWREFDREF